MSGPWPEKWLNDSAEAFKVSTLEELNKTKWVKILALNIKIEIEGYIKMMEKAIEIINVTDGLEAYLDNFNCEIMDIKNVYEACNNGFTRNI